AAWGGGGPAPEALGGRRGGGGAGPRRGVGARVGNRRGAGGDARGGARDGELDPRGACALCRRGGGKRDPGPVWWERQCRQCGRVPLLARDRRRSRGWCQLEG